MSGDAHAHCADASYRPVVDPGEWTDVAVDTGRWDRAATRLEELRATRPAWMEMVTHGVLLASAHQSGALDRLYEGDEDLTRRLLGGRADLADVAGTTAEGVSISEHVQANRRALGLAREAIDEPFASQAWIRRAHAVACAPQLTHSVATDVGEQEHVLAHGDYKHHANHRRRTDGTWEVTAPVSALEQEMARLVERLRSDELLRLHPAARAAYAHHALSHIQPFADGNGRVARTMASVYLLRAGSFPLLVMGDDAAVYEVALDAAEAGNHAALVDFVLARCCALVDRIECLLADSGESCEQSDALARWTRRQRASAELQAFLGEAAARALTRHQRRSDLRWLSRLDDAVVLTPGASRPPCIQVPLDNATVIDEALTVDAHPISGDGEGLLVTAHHARFSVAVQPADIVPTISDDVDQRLQDWLDRVVTALAVRVAAELE